MGTEKESPEPDCQKQFQAAVSVIQNLPKNGSYRPSYEEMLRFYSYYKQATMGPCLVPRPGFWDPIGRYKWDAWNSLGKMSREEAMSAYITEMKLVAQKVIDTVPLGEVAEDMFGYFEPLYQVIPDMPRPPETFLRRVAGWKDQVVNGDAGAVSEPPCLPKELAPPSPESHPSRDLDSEVFCDSLEQREPELQVWAEQRAASGGKRDPRNSPVPPTEKEGSTAGPQELDVWLLGTVRALQKSMQEVQARVQSLESMPRPPKQRPAAQAQCSAMAPWAPGAHAALLPPVALRRPVALPNVSDPKEEVQLLGKLGLGPAPGRMIGWEAAGGRPGGPDQLSEQAPGEGDERSLLAFLPCRPPPPPHTLRTSSLKIHLQTNVSLNKRKP
ncbi:acyl-CoA-binding domain-containing protein 4 isoform X5 [Rhinopithecus roxellana]|uniref:acyl-CoA-binding domain-containing protein 4 isoform X5 n=1 Tax=Rhinopithecus roxellana TaxID=61622 RepID=UPI001237384E|nr:acyl-CoA-binding domain-containing protein 4 isoform X5 [Rhinopithecus roxellana]